MTKGYMKAGNNPLDETMEEAARKTWGGDPAPELAGTKREKIELISIYNIHRDYRQPRRAIPSEIRSFPASDLSVSIGYWFDRSGAAHLDIDGLINNTYELPEDFEPPPLLEGFLRLVDLAGSINRDGLINPITVVFNEKTSAYELETGERRLLAYHLLHTLYGEKYARIPARIVPTLDVWRQATENNARDDLNAIGRARQLAILLMDVLGNNQFQPLEAFEHEQDYYAQVGDGELYRTPRGAAPKIISAMGLRNVNQLRHYRALLRLPHDLWIRADDENWTERQIRDYTVTSVTVSSEAPAPPPPAAVNDPHESEQLERIFHPITGVITDKSEGNQPLLKFAGWGRGDMNRLKRIAKWGEEIVVQDESERKEKLNEIGQTLLALEEMKRRLGG